MPSTQEKLIELLALNGTVFISGQDISETLNISRTAVWKQMKRLEKEGYQIEAVPNKGYRIVALPSIMSKNTLQWGLKTKWLGKNMVHQIKMPSTQTKANQLAQEGCAHGTVVIADRQETGRGRMNRSWFSNNDLGVWLSIVLRPNVPPLQGPQLTLVVATVLAELIELDVGITPAIKWPNDILINGKKIAGILTEMQAEQDKIHHIVIGIGLNVNQLADSFENEISKRATSLKIETGETFEKQKLIQSLLKRFEEAFDRYQLTGFSEVKDKWESFGYKINEEVSYKAGNVEKQGVIRGISTDGALIMENKQNQIETLYSAEINW
ncbi:biotin--[acetyl-CoA-carboxylase] ligase [Paraliobacillus sediminis]|uniref:biotin--[acetyl-CoA-carboxylase] ligase n=1 Tax=Paraliobacillus sediminis TaxID=1885916 RepID=UPI000E3C06DB|nr:biotin--[acetyl-CoA-carboxylase] ligase [Paraliobacillus sediminis]